MRKSLRLKRFYLQMLLYFIHPDWCCYGIAPPDKKETYYIFMRA